MRILIAEDDRFSVMLETVLSRWGYDVAAVEDGGEALNALQSPNSPTLAILDWNMPTMDGPDVCRRDLPAR
ncbi:MAG: response regulator [Planctomycetota bacterium]